MTFTGFPEAAFDFYDDLEIDNSKVFWEAHKAQYRSDVREPMTALMDELAGEFGAAKIFRPYRDVRFAKDKTPYKTHQGAFVAAAPDAPATGYYAEIAAPGFRVAGGFYQADGPRLAAVRTAIDHPRHGAGLEKILTALTADGWTLDGDRLKTAPRGWSTGHPRIELLRYRSLTPIRSYGFDPVIHTPELADRIRRDWRGLRPLVEWISEHGRT
ncbi:hypothetical protein GOHSU_28_00610 [Gordonia hirsuta DSM 44140 = NBRC 16056]|uniref:TIGR02453 family protein n=1 Tax=Gordonia hirsuta DSM 44140 = NBRC 16056 TaxID=1121927 RepID=L7LBB6_9ACTN|nr:DUF2461 domain-containing protein [Gordonia hirsuta]GAC58006.1 hypothetical protein GOHSU_28_00610 [Gordonia hirsuta DSM 44140 = NBRC 16056]